MPKSNVFSGIRMRVSVVNYWRTYAGFGYFVFQSAIDDLQVGQFTLIAYAVDINFNPLNGSTPVATHESSYNSFPATLPNTTFANNYLSLAQLNNDLYPPGEPE